MSTRSGKEALITQLLRYARSEITPSSVGLKPHVGRGRKPANKGLSQKQTAELLKWGDERLYAQIELARREPTISECEQIVVALKLTSAQRVDLYLFGRGHEPSPANVCPPSMEVWRDLIPDMGGGGRNGLIAYMTDPGWDLVDHNEAFAWIFPRGRVPQNTFEWMVWDGRDQLPDHLLSWRVPLMAQLDASLARDPDNQRLQELLDRVLKDPELGPIYEAHHRSYQHPDGDARPLFHRGLKKRGTLIIAAAAPFLAAGNRLVVMRFVPDITPDELRVQRGWTKPPFAEV